MEETRHDTVDKLHRLEQELVRTLDRVVDSCDFPLRVVHPVFELKLPGFLVSELVAVIRIDVEGSGTAIRSRLYGLFARCAVSTPDGREPRYARKSSVVNRPHPECQSLRYL